MIIYSLVTESIRAEIQQTEDVLAEPPPELQAGAKKRSGWRRLGLGYGWGLGRFKQQRELRKLELEQQQREVAEQEYLPSHFQEDAMLSQNPSQTNSRTRGGERTPGGRAHTSPRKLYSTDSNLTIPVPGPEFGNGMNAPVLSAKGSIGGGYNGGLVPSNNMIRSNTQTSNANSARPSQRSGRSEDTLVGSAVVRKMNDLGPQRSRVDTTERLAGVRALMATSGGEGGLGF